MEYPNLPLVEEKTKNILWNHYKIKPPYVFDIQVFKQTFSDTAGLFRKNASDFAGQAFTDYYITVIQEESNDIVMIFQGNSPVYGLDNYNTEIFNQDIRNREIVPLYKSDKYEKEKVNG